MDTPPPAPPRLLSQRLAALVQQGEAEVSFAAISQRLGTGGLAAILILFSAPTALPLPALPGLTLLLSLPVMLCAVQMVLRRRSLWMPRWLGRRRLSAAWLTKALGVLVPWVEKAERKLKPRAGWLVHPYSEPLLGCAALICACSVALPFPFTNTIPSIGIVLMALGWLMRDGVAVLAGMLVGALGVTLAVAVYVGGVAAIKALF